MHIEQRFSRFGGGLHNPHTVVWHCMDSEIDFSTGKIPAYEHLENLEISVHLLIYPDGRIVQMRKFGEIAWHAKGHNLGTIGVEFLVDGLFTNIDEFWERIKKPWYTARQYESGVWVMRNLFPELEMVQHCEIDTRVRNGSKVKQDLGTGFPWETFKSDCKYV